LGDDFDPIGDELSNGLWGICLAPVPLKLGRWVLTRGEGYGLCSVNERDEVEPGPGKSPGRGEGCEAEARVINMSGFLGLESHPLMLELPIIPPESTGPAWLVESRRLYMLSKAR
jgi:hypothetical protein